MPVTLITVSSGFFLSVETFCVNGRAHATARRRFLSHFPGDHERVWARSGKTEPRPRRYELRPETWTRLMVAVMRLLVGPDPGILPGSGP